MIPQRLTRIPLVSHVIQDELAAELDELEQEELNKKLMDTETPTQMGLPSVPSHEELGKNGEICWYTEPYRQRINHSFNCLSSIHRTIFYRGRRRGGGGTQGTAREHGDVESTQPCRTINHLIYSLHCILGIIGKGDEPMVSLLAFASREVNGEHMHSME